MERLSIYYGRDFSMLENDIFMTQVLLVHAARRLIY